MAKDKLAEWMSRRAREWHRENPAKEYINPVSHTHENMVMPEGFAENTVLDDDEPEFEPKESSPIDYTHLERSSEGLVLGFLEWLVLINPGTDHTWSDFNLMNHQLSKEQCITIFANLRRDERQEIREILADIMMDDDGSIDDMLRINSYLLLFNTHTNKELLEEQELYEEFSREFSSGE